MRGVLLFYLYALGHREEGIMKLLLFEVVLAALFWQTAADCYFCMIRPCDGKAEPK